MPYWFDGNNLIGKSAAAAAADSAPQRAFLELLSQYSRSGGGRFLVFFDGDELERRMPPKGIRVRFSAPESADRAILNALSNASSPHEVIVVTNDRALSARCRDAGARTLTWGQFMQKRRPPLKASRDRSEADRVDVGEWAEFFGLDPTDLE